MFSTRSFIPPLKCLAAALQSQLQHSSRLLGTRRVLKDALHVPRLQPQGLTLGYDDFLGAGGPHRTRRAHAGGAQQVHVPPSDQFTLPGLNLSDLLQNPSSFSRRLVQKKGWDTGESIEVGNVSSRLSGRGPAALPSHPLLLPPFLPGASRAISFFSSHLNF